jgi:hypothetical protein
MKNNVSPLKSLNKKYLVTGTNKEAKNIKEM